MYIRDPKRRECLDGMVKKTNDWKRELEWVGKKGLIVFDDVGYGRDQDRLRKEGYRVFGGSAFGDRLEKNREYGQKILEECGIAILPSFRFENPKNAITFLRKHPGQWVIKQNSHQSSLNYVGKVDDGEDVLSVLKKYEEVGIQDIDLQKKVTGIEIGVARYFNGKDWIGPIEINVEHKSLFNDGIGPKTGEMGTVMWYTDNENNRLFCQTLAKMKSYLQKIDFRGDIDINCILDKDTLYPLEITSRFGCPSTQLQTEIHLSPWTEFLSAVADGKSYDLKYKHGFGVVVSVAAPPFPYEGISSIYSSKGVRVFFSSPLFRKERNQVHFEEISRDGGVEGKNYYISGSNGFILYVTGFGNSIERAREEAYRVVEKIIVPKMFYRTDIGVQFAEKELPLLQKWGWVS
jgi:phosphoribosylamine--glycine ligase